MTPRRYLATNVWRTAISLLPASVACPNNWRCFLKQHDFCAHSTTATARTCRLSKIIAAPVCAPSAMSAYLITRWHGARRALTFTGHVYASYHIACGISLPNAYLYLLRTTHAAPRNEYSVRCGLTQRTHAPRCLDSAHRDGIWFRHAKQHFTNAAHRAARSATRRVACRFAAAHMGARTPPHRSPYRDSCCVYVYIALAAAFGLDARSAARTTHYTHHTTFPPAWTLLHWLPLTRSGAPEQRVLGARRRSAAPAAAYAHARAHCSSTFHHTWNVYRFVSHVYIAVCCALDLFGPDGWTSAPAYTMPFLPTTPLLRCAFPRCLQRTSRRGSSPGA